MKYRLQHYTAYHYSTPVSQCHNELRMMPTGRHNQIVNACKISLSPEPNAYFERTDYFGNRVASFNIHRSHTKLVVHSTVDVETTLNPVSPEHAGNIAWEDVRSITGSQLSLETIRAREFLYPSELTPAATADVADYSTRFFTPGKKIIDAVTELTQSIFKEFTYTPGFTTVSTTIREIMEHKKGVCQDFAHLAIVCLRSMGIAARYVSGYLETLPPKGKEKLIGADASHAWFSVYIPSIGWLDFDPTNNQLANNQYITLAVGRDYADVVPLKGVVYGGGHHTLEVRVDVRPIAEKHVNLYAYATKTYEEKIS